MGKGFFCASCHLYFPNMKGKQVSQGKGRSSWLTPLAKVKKELKWDHHGTYCSLQVDQLVHQLASISMQQLA